MTFFSVKLEAQFSQKWLADIDLQKTITVTLLGARWCLKSPPSLFTQPFLQAQMKDNIKGLRHWPLCGEFSGHKRPVTRNMFPFCYVIMSNEKDECGLFKRRSWWACDGNARVWLTSLVSQLHRPIDWLVSNHIHNKINNRIRGIHLWCDISIRCLLGVTL